MFESQENFINLIRNAKHGDQDAFGKLYEQCFEQIFRYIYRRVQDKQNAEDLTEDVFMKAWQSLPNLAKDEAFVAWLYTIARNKLTDYYRTSAKNSNLPLEAAWQIADHAPLPDELINYGQNAIHLQNYLVQLPPAYQEILELRFYQQLEIVEIAQILKKSAGAVRVLQLRALARLKKILLDNKAND